MTEYLFQSLIKIFIQTCSRPYIAEQFTWKDKETFFLNQAFTCFFCLFISHLRIIKIYISCLNLTTIYICSNILRNISVKHGAENIVLEIPPIYCSTKFISNRPNCTMQFFSFLLFFSINHFDCPPFSLIICLHRHSVRFQSMHPLLIS